MPPPSYAHVYYVGITEDDAAIEVSVPDKRLNFRQARDMAETMLGLLETVNH